MAKKERKRNETQRLTRDLVFIDGGRELSGGVPE
jgi:hypothetical protein